MKIVDALSEGRGARWLQWPTNLIVVSVIILVVLSASFGAMKLKFRGDYNIFFDENNPQLLAFEEIQGRFAKMDNLAIVISPKQGDIFNQETLSVIKTLTEQAWNTPYSSRVDSLANYQHTEAVEDDLWVEGLIGDDFSYSADQIDKVKRIALSEPLIVHSLVSAKGHVAVINITVQLPEKDKTQEVAEVFEFVTQLVDEQQRENSQLHFYKTGVVSMNYAFMASAQQDIMTLVPLMLIVVLLILTFMLGSFSGTLATLIVIIASVCTTIGLSGWVSLNLNIATVNIPTLILTLAVADCVHIIATMQLKMKQGLEKSAAIHSSLKVNTLPVLITSVTTAIGFFMMNMSDSPVLRHFGTLAAFGVMVACILSLTLLPLLLALLPLSARKESAVSSYDIMERIAHFVTRNHRFLLFTSIVIMVVTLSLIPSNRINDDSVKYFAKSSEFRQAVDFMQDNISGMGSISLAIDSAEENGVVSPNFIEFVEHFTLWLRAQPEVDHVASMSDTFKRLNMNMHGDDSTYYRLPENRELTAQYLLMYEMSLPYGLDLNNQINIDKSALKLQVITDNLGSDQMLDLERRIAQWFDNNTSIGILGDSGYKLTASSPALMFAHIGETNMRSMLISLPISLALISVLLVFALKSLKLGAISIVPTLMPALIGFGIWALLVGEINLGLSVVASLTLGIVVDDAVHFLAKYRLARIDGKSAEESVHYAFHTVGRALWVTTVVLIAGFLVLALSSFRLNSDMGKLSSMVIFIALVVDFFFLPALLLLIDKKGNKVTRIKGVENEM